MDLLYIICAMLYIVTFKHMNIPMLAYARIILRSLYSNTQMKQINIVSSTHINIAMYNT